MVVLAWQSNAKSHLPQQSSILACRADSKSSSINQIVQIAQGSNYLRERGWRRHSSARHPCSPSTRWSQRNQHSESSATALPGPSMGSGIQGVSLKYCGIQKGSPHPRGISKFKLVLWPLQWPVATSIASFQWALLCISLLVFHEHSSPRRRPSSQSASCCRQAPGQILQNLGSFYPPPAFQWH